MTTASLCCCFWFIGIWYEQASSAWFSKLQDDLLEHQRKVIHECFDTIKHLKQGYEQNRPSDVVDKDDPDWWKKM